MQSVIIVLWWVSSLSLPIAGTWVIRCVQNFHLASHPPQTRGPQARSRWASAACCRPADQGQRAQTTKFSQILWWVPGDGTGINYSGGGQARVAGVRLGKVGGRGSKNRKKQWY